MSIMTIIYFVLILSAIIIIHELGHLITAKHFNVYCNEFSIGMGPVIYKRQFKETQFSIRALPIGGFVSMAGEEGVEDENIPFERTIKGIKVWKQIVVMAAGAFMNIMLAWIIFIGITMVQGQVNLPPEPVLAVVEEGSPAADAGFQVGDRIIEMSADGKTLQPDNYNEITEQLQYYPQETTFQVQRGEEKITIVMTPQYIKDDNMYYLEGIKVKRNVKELTLVESFEYGTKQMVSSAQSIFTALGKLVQGVGLQNLSGPVGIFKATAEITQAGWISSLTWLGLLSINIGIFNLLPLPVLDGGRIFILLLEKITGRKMSEKMETGIMMAGVAMLILIMVFATWQDILRLF